MDKTDLYWMRRVNELERRIELLEAQLAAGRGKPLDGDYYSINEFARAMNLSRATIERRVKAGEINAKKVGRRYRIPKSELEIVMSE